MALVACKECGTQVAQSAPACPKCGVSKPGAATGRLVIIRQSAATGFANPVQVLVDKQLVGEVKNGSQLELELAAGERLVEVRGGGMSREARIRMQDGKTTRYQMYFSAWGVLGGGLNFKPA